MSHPVIHFEIVSEHAEKLRAFYAGVFDWTFSAPMPTGTAGAGDYATVDTRSAAGNGITGGIASATNGYPGHVTFYIYSDDIERTLRDVESRGGKTLIPPSAVPGTPMQIALFEDPAGNTVGLVNPGEM